MMGQLGPSPSKSGHHRVSRVGGSRRGSTTAVSGRRQRGIGDGSSEVPGTIMAATAAVSTTQLEAQNLQVQFPTLSRTWLFGVKIGKTDSR
jgi:hypothetical protein